MNPDLLISLLGIAVVVLVLNSVTKTTLTLQGGDRIAQMVNAAVWHAALLLHRLLRTRRPLRGVGVTSLLLVIAVWTVLHWVGWTLFFLPHSDAVVSSPDGQPADFWSRVYFVGYSLITLGVGDYVPGSAPFQIATVLSAATGFFLVTLAVTYLVPVVTALVQARQFAMQVFLAGDTPEEVARTAIEEPERFALTASSLPSQLLLLSQRYFAYPVLHYFPSSDWPSSIAMALAVLDEALTISLELAGEVPRSSQALLSTLRAALDEHMRLVDTAFLAPSRRPPPPPAAGDLRAVGLDELSDEGVAEAFARHEGRRRLLLAMVEHELRDWREVYRPEERRKGAGSR